MNKRVNYFSAEGYRRLARNPFVDKKVLQFFQRKAPADAVVTPSQSSKKNPRGSRSRTSGGRPILSDEAAHLIAAALKGLLNE